MNCIPHIKLTVLRLIRTGVAGESWIIRSNDIRPSKKTVSMSNGEIQLGMCKTLRTLKKDINLQIINLELVHWQVLKATYSIITARDIRSMKILKQCCDKRCMECENTQIVDGAMIMKYRIMIGEKAWMVVGKLDWMILKDKKKFNTSRFSIKWYENTSHSYQIMIEHVL